MDELLMEKIELLIQGKLSPEEERAFSDQINSNQDLKEQYIAAKAVHAALEMEIASNLRSFLSNSRSGDQGAVKEKPRVLPLFIIGIAATILILFLATTTARFSLNDSSIADHYLVSSVAIRGAVEQQDVYFNEAVSAFYKDNYEAALSSLSLIDNGTGIINEEKEWLIVIIYLKAKGSSSQEFDTALNHILKNTNHTYYPQAKQLKKELNSFWKKLIFN